MPGVKLPKAKPPIRIEAEYTVALLRYIAFLRDQVRKTIIPRLQTLVSISGANLPTAPRGDSVERLDDRKVVDRLFLDLQDEASRAFPISWAEEVATRVAVDTEATSTKATETTFRRLLGVKPILQEPWLGPKADAFVSDNVELIQSIGTEYHRRVKGLVLRAVDRGTLNRDFAGQIERVFGSELEKVTANTRARARLIARDQVAKFNSALNQTRQQALGFTHYRWRTVGDERVRPTHRANNGKVFAWSDPPEETGHPGEDYQCRCYAEPVITEDSNIDPSLAGFFK